MRCLQVLVLVALSAALSAHASSIGPGTLELAGEMSFTNQSYSDDIGSASELESSVGLLYAVSSLVQIGGSVGLENQTTDFDNIESTSSTFFFGGADLVFNLGSSESVVPFIDLGVGLGAFSGDGFEDSETAFVFGVSPGIRFMVDRFAALSISASLSRTSNVSGIDGVNSTNFRLGAGLSIFPGGVQ